MDKNSRIQSWVRFPNSGVLCCYCMKRWQYNRPTGEGEQWREVSKNICHTLWYNLSPIITPTLKTRKLRLRGAKHFPQCEPGFCGPELLLWNMLHWITINVENPLRLKTISLSYILINVTSEAQKNLEIC